MSGATSPLTVSVGGLPGQGRVSSTTTCVRSSSFSTWLDLLIGNFCFGLSVLMTTSFCDRMETKMHSVIYLVGLIVVVLLILSFFGLR